MSLDIRRRADEAVKVAETYYDSHDADRFYSQIWGGEDIHVGLYDTADEPIAEASRRTVSRMMARLTGLSANTRVLDIGAGYGGAARQLVAAKGCQVDCLNLSDVQNETNRRQNLEQGLARHISVIHGSFEDIPASDQSYDVVWSEDAILHSGDRLRVLREVHRVLRPGGEFVFTDPMQADECPPGVLQPVYDRLHLSSLGSFRFYREAAVAIGFELIGIEDLTPNLGRHYEAVRRMLSARYDEMIAIASTAYVDRMLTGLANWVEAAGEGHLAWGILHFRKPAA